MLYLVGVGLEKKSGSIKNCGRRSDILDKMLPEIAFLTSDLVYIINLLSIKVLLFLQTLVGRRIWDCSELEARSSRKVFPWSDVSNFNIKVSKKNNCFIGFFGYIF